VRAGKASSILGWNGTRHTGPRVFRGDGWSVLGFRIKGIGRRLAPAEGDHIAVSGLEGRLSPRHWRRIHMARIETPPPAAIADINKAIGARDGSNRLRGLAIAAAASYWHALSIVTGRARSIGAEF
jgi:hypothetical protein